MMSKRIKYIVILISLGFIGIYCDNQQIVAGDKMSNSEKYELKIIMGDKVIEAVLDDNPTSRDFISLLPLDLELEDYANTEKISYLDRKLSTESAPSGTSAKIGDITYFAPWGNLAIFYKDFGYASSLIKFGEITSGVDLLKTPGSLNVRIELVQ
ncbi:MAG: cyclophilin-like fold protein [Ignavibacteria bacterium]|jgi:hypothetical protein